MSIRNRSNLESAGTDRVVIEGSFTLSGSTRQAPLWSRSVNELTLTRTATGSMKWELSGALKEVHEVRVTPYWNAGPDKALLIFQDSNVRSGAHASGTFSIVSGSQVGAPAVDPDWTKPSTISIAILGKNGSEQG